MDKEEFITKDSGKREKYISGAVRDVRSGKGRFDLITPIALKRLASVYERGSLKYSDRNWEKGMPLCRYLDSALRHLFQYLEGMRDEDHLAQAVWNVFSMIHVEEMIKRGKLPKELNLPNFPAKPSSRLNLGDKIYIIGNPGLTGINVREDYISDINGTAGENMKELAENTTDCFGIGKIVISGDSGTPVVNSKFELLGLCKYQFAGGLGYVQKIDCYLKHINSKK